MKLISISASILLFLLVSCGEKNKQVKVENNSLQDSVAVKNDSTKVDSLATPTTCYMQVLGKDTFTVSITIDGDQVTGTMANNFFEKDSSHGTLKGSIKDNIITANYHFYCEGSWSDMDVMFSKQEHSLIEGHGPYDETGTRFTDKSKIKFDKKDLLKKIECK